MKRVFQTIGLRGAVCALCILAVVHSVTAKRKETTLHVVGSVTASPGLSTLSVDGQAPAKQTRTTFEVTRIPANSTDVWVKLTTEQYTTKGRLRLQLHEASAWDENPIQAKNLMGPATMYLVQRTRQKKNRKYYVEASGKDGSRWLWLKGDIHVDLVITIRKNNINDFQAFVEVITDYYDGARLEADIEQKKKLVKNSIKQGHLQSKYQYQNLTILLAETDKAKMNNGLRTFYAQSVVEIGDVNSTTWNKEHVWPKSRAYPTLEGTPDSSGGAGSDMHHVRPSIIDMNGVRHNCDLGRVGDAAETTKYKISFMEKRQSCTFQPPTGVRGSAARMLFYVHIRWDGEDAPQSENQRYQLTLTRGEGRMEGELGRCMTLKKWAAIEKPSKEEIYRNNMVHFFQGNRNPFIDFYDDFKDLAYCA